MSTYISKSDNNKQFILLRLMLKGPVLCRSYNINRDYNERLLLYYSLHLRNNKYNIIKIALPCNDIIACFIFLNVGPPKKNIFSDYLLRSIFQTSYILLSFYLLSYLYQPPHKWKPQKITHKATKVVLLVKLLANFLIIKIRAVLRLILYWYLKPRK